MIASATSYAPHGTTGHLRPSSGASASSSPSGAYPPGGGGGYAHGVASHSEGAFYGPSNAGTIKKQLVFFANAWRLFVTALVSQSRVNAHRQATLPNCQQQQPQPLQYYHYQQVVPVAGPSNNPGYQGYPYYQNAYQNGQNAQNAQNAAHYQSYQQQLQLSGDFMQVTGIADAEKVRSAVDFLAKYTHVESLRSALKYFREHNLTAAFDALVAETGVLLEHPSITALYKFLVVEGNYSQVERFLKTALTEHLFMPYIRRAEVYGGRWTLLSGGCHRMYNTFSVFDHLRPPKVDPKKARLEEEQKKARGKRGAKDQPLFPKGTFFCY